MEAQNINCLIIQNGFQMKSLIFQLLQMESPQPHSDFPQLPALRASTSSTLPLVETSFQQEQIGSLPRQRRKTSEVHKKSRQYTLRPRPMKPEPEVASMKMEAQPTCKEEFESQSESMEQEPELDYLTSDQPLILEEQDRPYLVHYLTILFHIDTFIDLKKAENLQKILHYIYINEKIPLKQSHNIIQKMLRFHIEIRKNCKSVYQIITYMIEEMRITQEEYIEARKKIASMVLDKYKEILKIIPLKDPEFQEFLCIKAHKYYKNVETLLSEDFDFKVIFNLFKYMETSDAKERIQRSNEEETERLRKYKRQKNKLYQQRHQQRLKAQKEKMRAEKEKIRSENEEKIRKEKDQKLKEKLIKEEKKMKALEEKLRVQKENQTKTNQEKQKQRLEKQSERRQKLKEQREREKIEHLENQNQRLRRNNLIHNLLTEILSKKYDLEKNQNHINCLIKIVVEQIVAHDSTHSYTDEMIYEIKTISKLYHLKRIQKHKGIKEMLVSAKNQSTQEERTQLKLSIAKIFLKTWYEDLICHVTFSNDQLLDYIQAQASKYEQNHLLFLEDPENIFLLQGLLKITQTKEKVSERLLIAIKSNLWTKEMGNKVKIFYKEIKEKKKSQQEMEENSFQIQFLQFLVNDLEENMPDEIQGKSLLHILFGQLEKWFCVPVQRRRRFQMKEKEVEGPRVYYQKEVEPIEKVKQKQAEVTKMQEQRQVEDARREVRTNRQTLMEMMREFEEEEEAKKEAKRRRMGEKYTRRNEAKKIVTKQKMDDQVQQQVNGDESIFDVLCIGDNNGEDK